MDGRRPCRGRAARRCISTPGLAANASMPICSGPPSRCSASTASRSSMSRSPRLPKSSSACAAEKAAGKVDGTVDLVWINGENFLTMKREGLLFGPFAENLPNFRYVDVVGKPTTRIDFSEPVEGMESPWGMAQLTFFADRKRVPTAPRNMVELLTFAKANPGRITYPRPAEFPWHHFHQTGAGRSPERPQRLVRTCHAQAIGQRSNAAVGLPRRPAPAVVAQPDASSRPMRQRCAR